jgi:hypothetical protein
LLQDIYFDEWAEYFGECITSCGKVENCLVSEYDPDLAMLVERRARRWSAARQSLAQAQANNTSGVPAASPNVLGSPQNFKSKSKGRGTVLRVPMLSPKLFQLTMGSRSQNQQRKGEQDPSSPGDGVEECGDLSLPSSSNGSRSNKTVSLKTMPFFRSHIMKEREAGSGSGGNGSEPGKDSHGPPPRSCSVIDEDSV